MEVMCAHCASPIPVDGMVDSGAVVVCPDCQKETIVDLWQPDDRKEFFSRPFAHRIIDTSTAEGLHYAISVMWKAIEAVQPAWFKEDPTSTAIARLFAMVCLHGRSAIIVPACVRRYNVMIRRRSGGGVHAEISFPDDKGKITVFLVDS